MFALLVAVLALDPVADCENRLLSYASWVETSDTAWALDLEATGGGHLTYVGALHSRDAEDGQFAAIDAAFRTAQPTLVFYEGPDRGLGSDGPDTIRTRGESGYVRWLAAHDGARTEGLEPSAIDQFRVLAERFPADQVELFFVLREAARLRDREQVQGAALDVAVGSLLGRLDGLASGTGVDLPFSDVAGLAAAYGKYWNDGSDWRAAPAGWFDPTANDAQTGGRFMAAINAASSEVRNVHMYRRLAQSARAGEKVFALVGRNHVPMQAEALRCALGAG